MQYEYKVNEVTKAMFEIQKELAPLKKDEVNPYYDSVYFDINSVLAILKPLLTKYGLLVRQPLTYIAVDGLIEPAIKTQIVHVGTGNCYEEVTPLLRNPDAQKYGGGITYFRRFCLVAMFCLEAQDDDGNLASGKTKDVNVKKPVSTWTNSQSKPATITFKEKTQEAQSLMGKPVPMVVKPANSVKN